MWSQADLVILVPMLGRPHRVGPLLSSIAAATPDARVLFLVSPADRQVHRAIDAHGQERLTVPRHVNGDYARKINTGYRHTTEPLLFTAADDLDFHPGWFEFATAALDDKIGVVGTRDKCNRRTKWHHSTHSLVTRWYADLGTIDEPHKIYHEGYPHELVDDELVETAIFRKAYRHCHKAIVEHLHPMAHKAPMDGSYAKQTVRILAGRPLFEARRHLWS